MCASICVSGWVLHHCMCIKWNILLFHIPYTLALKWGSICMRAYVRVCYAGTISEYEAVLIVCRGRMGFDASLCVCVRALKRGTLHSEQVFPAAVRLWLHWEMHPCCFSIRWLIWSPESSEGGFLLNAPLEFSHERITSVSL